MKAVDPRLLVTEMLPMDTLLERAQAGTRFSLLLIGVFAVIAALLASVGLYGVLATVVRHGKGAKVSIVKFRRRKHYLRQKNHRQLYTEVKVTDIRAG